jgi:hypothetical protein
VNKKLKYYGSTIVIFIDLVIINSQGRILLKKYILINYLNSYGKNT